MITKEYSKDLTGKNSFRMPVGCRVFIEYDSVTDLLDLDFEDLLTPVKHIGAGSNLLFTKDFEGTILHSKVKFIEKLPHGHVSVGAGVSFDDFCAWAAQEGLWGPENLSYIPGEVGAAAVQNIGAYGVEAKDIIKTVYAYDVKEEEFVHFSVDECGYGYRESVFKTPEFKDRYIITHVVFALSREPRPRLDYSRALAALKEDPDLSPQKVRDFVIAIRKEKLPEISQVGSAGSFFKNPIVSREIYEKVVKVASAAAGSSATAGSSAAGSSAAGSSASADSAASTAAAAGGASVASSAAAAAGGVPHYELEGGLVKIPAAWLIEQCGWKGRRSGNAGVWDKQALVLVNATGRALPEEILALEAKIRSSVKQKFGILLDCEVEHI